MPNMLKMIDPFTDKRWDDFVTRNPEGIIFHLSAWARVLTGLYGDLFKYYVLEGNNGEILGAAPFFHLNKPLLGNVLICLPSTDTCFPIANNRNNYEELLGAIIEDISQDKTVSLEIKGLNGFGLPQGSPLWCGSSNVLVQLIDIERDLDVIHAGMTRNCRYNLRLAEKQSIQVKLGQDEKDLKELYKMLVNTLRENKALPPAYSFFRSIFQNLIINGKGCMLFAEYRGKVIAGNMYLYFKDTALCKYSGQVNGYSENRANYLLHWNAIQHFHKESFRYYDFGGTDRNDHGLLFFKRNWGVAENTRSYYYYPEGNISKPPILSKPFRMVGRALVPHLPTSTLTFLGKHVQKNSY